MSWDKFEAIIIKARGAYYGTIRESLIWRIRSGRLRHLSRQVMTFDMERARKIAQQAGNSFGADMLNDACDEITRLRDTNAELAASREMVRAKMEGRTDLLFNQLRAAEAKAAELEAKDAKAGDLRFLYDGLQIENTRLRSEIEQAKDRANQLCDEIMRLRKALTKGEGAKP